MIEIKEKVCDREELVDKVIDALTLLQAKFPEQEIYVEVPGNVARCRLGDAIIFDGMGSDGPVIAIDAE